MGQVKQRNVLFIFSSILILTSSFAVLQSVYGQESTQSPEYFFNINLLSPDNNQWRIDWADLIADELQEIGINASRTTGGWSGVSNRTYLQIQDGSSGVATFEDGGFDTVFFGFNREQWIEFQFRDERDVYTTDIPCGPEVSGACNISGETNSQLMEILRSGNEVYDVTERNALINTGQDIFYDEIPNSVLSYSAVSLLANKNAGFLEDLSNGYVNNILKDEWKNIESSDSSIFKIAQPWGIDDSFFSPLEQSPLKPQDSEIYQSMVWQGLLDRDIHDDLNWRPLIAASMPRWNEERTVATIDLRTDVTFADGQILDSEDVVESYRRIITPEFNSPAYNHFIDNTLVFGYPISYFASNNSIVALDDDTVQFTFTEAVNPHHENSMFSVGILPTHVFGNHTSTVNGIYNFENLVRGNVSEFGYGTGPFRFKQLDLTTDTLIFEGVDSYWNGVVQSEEIQFIKERESDPAITKLESGVYNLLSPWYWISPLASNVTSSENIDVSLPSTGLRQGMEYNLNHPVFGTGEATPFGEDNPDQATLAAKYVRQAINLVIPREKIIETIMEGFGLPGKTIFAPSQSGVSDDLPAYEYNPTKALELLAKAGYGVETTTSSSSVKEDSGNGFLILDYRVFILPLVTIIIIGVYRKQRK
ncbi:MAG: hypothetical protein GPJ54_15550 [Candidatus Heimdallarchaeota archaeon]|nr:hypothetical protein [Candidatus Heimdallarchaeota archaeon]